MTAEHRTGESSRVQLIDESEGPGRTTATLVASLTARLAALRVISGADAIGSLTAGFAALGREVSRTAEGMRLRRGLEAGRPGNNGNALWSALRMNTWLAGMPPSPVINQLHNDIALLLTDDLERTLAVLPIPSQTTTANAVEESDPYTFLDCALGLWAFSAQLVRSVEALATPTSPPAGNLYTAAASDRPDRRNSAVSVVDRLRPPAPWDPTRNQYKDWLHLNVFDYATGSIALINTSLHGAPDDPRSRVMGTAVAHIPGKGWLGNVEVAGFEDAAIGTGSIGLSRTGIAIDPNSGSILASVRDQRAGLSASFSALPITASIDIEDGLPLGRGWISWYVVPRLAASGDWMLAERRIDLATAGVYQDHTWGRWHWGEDFGWEWGCFLAEDGATFVIARTTNRAHTQLSKLMLIMQVGSERRTMSGTSIEVTYRGELVV